MPLTWAMVLAMGTASLPLVSMDSSPPWAEKRKIKSIHARTANVRRIRAGIVCGACSRRNALFLLLSAKERYHPFRDTPCTPVHFSTFSFSFQFHTEFMCKSVLFSFLQYFFSCVQGDILNPLTKLDTFPIILLVDSYIFIIFFRNSGNQISHLCL